MKERVNSILSRVSMEALGNATKPIYKVID